MKPRCPAHRRAVPLAAALLGGLLAQAVAVQARALAAQAPAGPAEEQPLVAGSEGVPVPKRTKTVPPEYPPEAAAQGIRGIVILDVVIDKNGKVASVDVVRSLPPLDDAAIAAVRKWEYEITKVDGKPVRVRLTVPITFAMKLPQLTRQEGIPELRQGAVPPYPMAGQAASVTAQVTLDPDGQVTEIQVVKGAAPWTDALLQALRTWRFAPEGPNVVLSFRVEADFVPGRKGSPAHVDLRASGLQRSESLTPALAATTPPAAASPAPAALPTPAPAAEPSPRPLAPAPQATPAAPAPAPPSSSPSAPAQTAVPAPVEVINVPPRGVASAPALPESGTSALRDVTLSAGVPDLTRGRRPVVPPLARISGTPGTVEVRFAVDAAGVASVQAVEGPELLKPAAQQAVVSWVFRRLSAQRLYLVATFTYKGDAASAIVRPQDAPESGTKTEATAKPQ